MKLILSILLLLTSCESIIYSDYKIINKKLNSNTYEVRRGDNLYSISRKLNLSISSLIKLNKIAPPYKIFPKQNLILPKQSFHKVKKGETLYSISRQYKTDVYSISKLNNLKNINSINEGQALKIYGDLKIETKSNYRSNVNKANLKKIDSKKKSLKFAKKKTPNLKQTFNKNSKFIWPIKGKLISKYGKSNDGFFNDGININSKLNQKVSASNDGVIIYSGNEIPGYGNLILIKHSQNWITAYAHLAKVSIEKGDKVKKGQIIGLVGKTGNVRKPQLHFEIRKGKEAVNPLNYLS
tara:strand:+ start:75 stop:962 length:888 start_codon:yes stop_codon:yes gene_type:complete